MIRNHYRRGAVLGLTIAEIFILLAFLLLFTLLGFFSDTEVGGDEHTQPINKVSAPIPWVRPEQYEVLVNKSERIERKLKKVETSLEESEKERDQLQNQVENLRQNLEQAQEEVFIATQEANLALLSEIDSESKLSITEKKLKTAKQEIQELSHQLYSQKKGDQPACWYRRVPKDGGGYREKRLYIFHAAIFGEGIVLEERSAPQGSADDDNGGHFGDEWRKLRVANLPYKIVLSDDEFVDAVKYISDMGRSSKVRTYPCVFSVKVWDMTPRDAKQRWKDTLKLIDYLFSTYTPVDESWNGFNPENELNQNT
ncbi:MAG: hypothetical protein OXE56_08045 [Gammaproteobacteria bacterium]|nr:hypothetical protein [Gammaproteobacteria bacterium]